MFATYMPRRKKFNIILDLDNTIISSVEVQEHKETAKSQKFDRSEMEGYYIIYHRPYLQEFLDYIFKNMNVAVWTSATPDYAKFIIKNIVCIKPNRKLDFILTDKHSTYSERKLGNQKHMDVIWDKYGSKGYHEGNTILLDNLDEIRKGQTCHVLPAKDFEYKNRSSARDTFLLKLIDLLEDKKEHLINPEHACPVRRILGRKKNV